ncbi:MAG: peptidylprolyl isomerase [Armatimonadetes bacterium]|nr:peptidylprolyl isomerase [Armatimonadota bacterium]
MRPVLVILGIAIAAIVISIATQRSKDLSPAPQEEAAAAKEAEQQAAWKKADAEQRAGERQATREFKPPTEGAKQITVNVAGKGAIVVEVYPKAAPQTVAQFVRLAQTGFYKDIKFHRVEPAFVVQAGDPDTKPVSGPRLVAMSMEERAALGIGSGGSGKNIPFEPNELAHVRGSIAMALNAPRSATGDSQFFINLKDNVGLNNDYCVFGKVTQGMDVVDKIAVGDAIESMAVK